MYTPWVSNKLQKSLPQLISDMRKFIILQYFFYKRRTSNAAALKLLDKMLRNYDRRSTPTNDMGKFFFLWRKTASHFFAWYILYWYAEINHIKYVQWYDQYLYIWEMYILYFLGIATNVSVELHVASLGSINTENMVIRYYNFEAW